MTMTEEPYRSRRDALHLFVLCSFAVAQPLFELLARNVDFFVARGSRPQDLVLLTLGLTLLPPLPLVLLEALFGRFSERLRDVVHRTLVAVLAGMFLLLLQNIYGGLPAGLGAAAAGALAASFSIFLLRTRLVQQFLDVLSFSLALFPVFFLVRPAVLKLVSPHEEVVPRAGRITTDSPIVMVIFDEFPLASLLDASLEIDPVRYPHLRELADGATWYRQATTVSDSTLTAVPAILTGNYPVEGRQAIAADHPANLFTLLQDHYEFRVFEDYTHLCPPEICGARSDGDLVLRMRSLFSDLTVVYLHLLLPPEWRGKLPAISLSWRNFADSQRWNQMNQGFLELVDAIEPARRRTLFFAHAPLPHGPYRFYPSGKVYSNAGGNPASAAWRKWGAWDEDEWVVTQSYQRHLLQVGYVDTLIGRLVERLRETGLYDEALIVVTADHGCSFRAADSRRAITETNASDIMSVPLLVKAPFQKEAEVSDRHVETIDILPTMATLLGIGLPWSIDGYSAVLPAAPERPSKHLFNGKELLSFDPAALDTQQRDTVARKLALFDSGKTRGLYTVGPLADELIGRRTADVMIRKPGKTRAALSLAERFDDVDPHSDVLPGEIAGYLSRDGEAAETRELAVAVNGIIRATTYTYRADGEVGTLTFSALVGDESFSSGANNVEIFAIDRNSGKLALERALPLSAPLHLNVNLAIDELPGVTTWGFRAVEKTDDGEKIRWTDKRAVLTVPMERRNQLTALRVELFIGAEDRSLEIRLNSKTVLEHPFPSHDGPTSRWSKTIPLDEVPFGKDLVVELISHKLGGGQFDQNFRGIAVGGLYLVSSPNPAAADRRTHERIFADGFETRNLESWDVVLPRP